MCLRGSRTKKIHYDTSSNKTGLKSLALHFCSLVTGRTLLLCANHNNRARRHVRSFDCFVFNLPRRRDKMLFGFGGPLGSSCSSFVAYVDNKPEREVAGECQGCQDEGKN